jgi:poly-gamma-glutamate synthesis protein (capsule biosynthesis protein)
MLSRYSSLCLLICLFFGTGCHKQENDRLKICFAGDLLLDRGVRQRIEHSGIDPVFANVSLLFHSSDAVIANLECPVTYHKAPLNKRFIFRGDPKWLGSLKKAGITHLTLANNHTYDQGRDGITETYNQLILHKIIPIGFGNRHTEACLPVIINKGGIQVAVFNSVLMPLEDFPFLPDKPCICQASANELASAVADYKLSNPKAFVVVVLHWGYEYQSIPEPVQRAEALKFVESGADAIIGHHPHVVQTIEFIKKIPVIYSLGNFVFDSHRPEASQGLIVQLTFTNSTLSIKGYPIKITNCIPEITGKPIDLSIHTGLNPVSAQPVSTN